MKKLIYIIIFIFATTLLFANVQIIESFTAANNSNTITIEWKTKSENNVSRFELQRLSNGMFKTLHSSLAKGVPTTYKYTDSDSFIKETISDNVQSANVATYRIKIVYSNGTPDSYTDEITATRNINSIKRTLGMLKEMFK